LWKILTGGPLKSISPFSCESWLAWTWLNYLTQLGKQIELVELYENAGFQMRGDPICAEALAAAEWAQNLLDLLPCTDPWVLE
jgi:hypothetical protein